MSKRTDVKKTDSLREYIFCNYWCFLEMHFRFQAEVCDDCHDLMQKAMRFNSAAIVLLKEMIIEFIFAI